MTGASSSVREAIVVVLMPAPGQPQAEIGVLGDVEGVPAADVAQDRGAEMVGGAAERHGQAPTRQGRQQDAEQAAVFGGEQGGEHVLAGVLGDQFGLDAAEIGIDGKQCRRAPQLVGLGHVLGIVDHDQFATHQRQGEVERLGLGQRRRVRHDHQLEAGGANLAPDRGDGRGAVGFDDDLHVELFRRIVEPAQRLDEMRHHMRLVAQGHEQRVDRQVGVGAERRAPLRMQPRQVEQGGEAEPRRQDEQHHEQRHQHRPGAERRRRRHHDQGHECGHEGEARRPRQFEARRGEGPLARQVLAAEIDEFVARARDEGAPQLGRRHHADAPADFRVGHRLAGQGEHLPEAGRDEQHLAVEHEKARRLAAGDVLDVSERRHQARRIRHDRRKGQTRPTRRPQKDGRLVDAAPGADEGKRIDPKGDRPRKQLPCFPGVAQSYG